MIYFREKIKINSSKILFESIILLKDNTYWRS